jgi:tRNA dimethylallyltransferase
MLSIAHRPKIIVIVGPTASGKSDLAVFLAKKLNGEVISADSRQVYRGMDIGTGKITRREMRGVPHHLLDVASPKQTFTAAQYQKLGRAAIRKILVKNKIPIVAGGTGFYIDTLLYDYALPHVPPNPLLRKRLEKKTVEGLFAELKRLDQRRAQTIDAKNKRRLVRALEIITMTKKPVPAPREALKRASPYDVLKIGIATPKEKLRRRINARLARRFKIGMMGEVRRLHASGLSWQKLDSFGLEYRYASRHLRGLISKEKTIGELQNKIWQYARRQMTWFRKDKKTLWIDKQGMY